MDKLVHVVGIAGSGMSALAETARACGYAVSGSDRTHDQGAASATLDRLRRNGCRLFLQDGSGLRAGADVVVVSSAIEPGNPDLLAAQERGIPVLHRAAFLAELVGDRTCLAVAGTSGKSTVTGMVGWILAHCGADPMVVNGAAVCGWEGPARVGSVRLGRQQLWVIELDESDRSLLHFAPTHAVITNCSADHFSLAETKALFQAFEGHVRGACMRGPWRAEDVQMAAGGSRFCYGGVAFTLGIPGRHNVENAVAASALCQAYGIDLPQSAAALAVFPGLRRRLEVCGRAGGVTVLDDFAHNPAKIQAALDAVLPYYRRTLVVWRPHGFGPLRTLLPGLTRAFSVLRGGTHRLILLPVYDAGGTADRTVRSQDLAKALQAEGVMVTGAADLVAVTRELAASPATSGDAILVMGARDPGLPVLAHRLVRQLQASLK